MTNNLLDAPAVPPPTPSELDELISRDPLDLAAIDIDRIIAMQRQYRAQREAPKSGRKPKAAPTQTIDLAAALGLVKPPPVVTPSAAGGFRRL